MTRRANPSLNHNRTRNITMDTFAGMIAVAALVTLLCLRRDRTRVTAPETRQAQNEILMNLELSRKPQP